MFTEIKPNSASLETAYWLENQGGHTPASTILHHRFVSLIRKGDIFLDVGCGYGRITRALDALGVKVFGIDPNIKELLSGKDQTPDSRYVQAYGEQLPFPSDCFDGVVVLGVLGAVNMDARKRILKETVRTLKVGGSIYVAEFALISDPLQRTYHGNQLWSDVYEQDSKTTGEYGSVVVHHMNDWGTYFIAHHFRRSELCGLLQGAGIDVAARKKATVRSRVSGQLRDTFNIWGSKH